MRKTILNTLTATIGFTSLCLAAVSFASPVEVVQKRWAEVRYALPEDQREAAFETLANSSRKIAKESKNAEAWIWNGIVLSTYAGQKGGLGALKLVKEARSALEKAMEYDPTALHGSAYTSLGALYYQVPGWPVGFGSDKKAEKLLKEGLELNPDGIDSNFFYGDFLLNERKYAESQAALQKALAAPPRPGRELADQGRRQEIAEKLAVIQKKLN